MTERKRRLLWVLAVILAFVLGFWLGMRFCRRSGGTGGGTIIGHGGGGSAGGAAAHLGQGNGKGTTSGGGYLNAPNDTDSVAGGGTARGGGSSDAAGGGTGGGGGTPFDSGQFGKKPNATDTLSEGFVAGLATDQLTGRNPKDPPPPPDPRITTRTADDFSLDRTGLPRFPMDVTNAFSGVSTRSDVPADTGIGVVFATSDSFDSVSSWYSHHMPMSASTVKIDAQKLSAMAKQLTPKNIMKMFGASGDSQPALDTTATDSAQPAEKVAGWSIPDDGVHGKQSVMVLSHPGKPTMVIMSRSRRP